MISRAAGGGVMNVSSPKFIDPVSTPHMSGLARRPPIRSSMLIVLDPPVDTLVTARGEPALIWSMTATNSSGRPLGVPSSSRTCSATIAAPASTDRRLDSAISVGV